MAHDVFISYSNQDKLTADAMCATLEAQGIRCWIAPRDIIPGQEWGEAIVGGITEARVMVVVFSHHSNESRQVMREVERAVNAGLAVLPFRIEDVTPSGSMEYFLSSMHWLDALTDNMEEHILSLAANVQSLLGKAGEAPKRRVPGAAAPAARKTPKAKSPFLSGRLKFISGAAVVVLALFILFFDFGGEEGDTVVEGEDGAAAIAVMEAAGIRKLKIEKVDEQDAPAAGVQFSASLTDDGIALTDKLKWNIYDENNKRIKSAHDIVPKFALPAGVYRLEVERDGLKGAAVFKSRDEKATSYAVVLGAGWMQASAVVAEGGQPMGDGLAWQVFDDATDPKKPLLKNYADQPRLLFFEGTYRVTANKGNAATEGAVEIRQGETVTTQLVLGAGTLVMTATLEEGGSPVSSDLAWQVYPADQPEDKSPVAKTYDAKTSLLVPAGRYRVRASHHHAQAYVVTNVEAGDTTEGVVNLNAGGLRALARLEGKGTQMSGDLSWHLNTPATGMGGKAKRITRTYDDTPAFVIPAGDYELTLKSGTAETTVTASVTPGQVTELEVVISVGRIQVAVVDGDGKTEFEKKPSCQIMTRAEGAFGPKPKQVSKFYGTAGEAILASGAYTVNCKAEDREGTADADIQSGDVTTVQLVIS